MEEKGPCRRQNYYCSVLNFHGDAGDEEKVKEQLRKVNRGDMPPHLFIYFFSALFIWVSKNQNYGNPSSQSEQKSTSSLANEDSMQKQANYQKRGETSSHDWFSRLVFTIGLMYEKSF